MVSTSDEILNEVATTDVQKVPEIKSISEEDFEKAQKVFQLGKKNLFLNKFDESVNNIGEACKIYSTKFGELDPQCAEIYFFYGRALLELARVENTVLGNALSGVPEDTGPIDDSRYGNPEDIAADEKQEISEKVIDALCDRDEVSEKKPELNGKSDGSATTTTETVETNGKSETEKDTNGKMETETETETNGKLETEAATTTVSTTTTSEKSETDETKMVTCEETKTVEKPAESAETGATAEKLTKEEETKTENGDAKPTEENGAAEEECADEEDTAEDGEAEEGEDITKNEEQAKDEAEAEEISNLQRSWEMFELAKLIYTKNYDNEMLFKNKRIAECLLKLGEISIEQEIYDQAINDINESIRLQEEQKEERDERMLAESFYQLGLAQQFNNQFSDANESYQKSINIMQLRIEKLKGKLEAASSDADGELEKTTIKEEINDLEALLPEMTAKLEEVNEQGQQSLTLIKEAKECFLNTITSETKTNGTTGATTPTNGEVKDITSLVKSKRKISASPAGDEGVNVKKTRLSADDTKPEEKPITNGNHHSTEVNNVEMADETEKEAEAAPAAAAAAAVTVTEPITQETKTSLETEVTLTPASTETSVAAESSKPADTTSTEVTTNSAETEKTETTKIEEVPATEEPKVEVEKILVDEPTPKETETKEPETKIETETKSETPILDAQSEATTKTEETTPESAKPIEETKPTTTITEETAAPSAETSEAVPTTTTTTTAETAATTTEATPTSSD